MSSKRYTEEFKIEAVKQVTERGHGIYSVAARLGITHMSLYAWIKRYGDQPPTQQPTVDANGHSRQSPSESGRMIVSPLAARMAAEAGLDLRTLQGTGPGGRIIK